MEKDLFGFNKTNLIIGKGQDIQVPTLSPTVTEMLMPLYDNYNQVSFDSSVSVPRPFGALNELVYETFKQKKPTIRYVEGEKVTLTGDTRDVLLAFSGGLDSCYQAIRLKDAGYNVHLFHVKSVNAYEGGVQLHAVEDFAQRMGMELIYATWKRKGNKETNKYYQTWGDNAIKNQLIEAIMIDLCAERGWNKFSLGDDESISVYDSDAKLGINITDCKEIQHTFLDGLSMVCDGYEYIGIERGEKSTDANKYARLYMLEKRGCADAYYSCVGSGRFNQYNHDTCEKKYGVHLHKYNCGCYCTKCAIHNLLLHYVGHVDFPIDFVLACWERLWKTKYGSFDELFGKNVPLDERIKNLLTY